jgi:hypothetical protein
MSTVLVFGSIRRILRVSRPFRVDAMCMMG